MSTKAELEAENAELRGRIWTLSAVIRSMCEADRHMSKALEHMNEAGSIRREAFDMLSPLAQYEAPDA